MELQALILSRRRVIRCLRYLRVMLVESTMLTNKHSCCYSFAEQAASFVSAVQANGQFSAKYLPRELVAMEALPTRNALGESPVWSEKDQALYWVS